jgi:hypothetical protein
MPPKQQAALLQPASVPPPAPAPAAPAARRSRGLTAAKFYSAVAAALDDDKKITAKHVRHVLIGIGNVVASEFAQEAKQVTVPYVCRFRIRKLAARASSTKVAFGKQVELKARGASSTLKASPSKVLKDEFNAVGAGA